MQSNTATVRGHGLRPHCRTHRIAFDRSSRRNANWGKRGPIGPSLHNHLILLEKIDGGGGNRTPVRK
jgi:hypothetical protein